MMFILGLTDILPSMEVDMATTEKRVLNVESEVNQLKGAYDHLATKADVQKPSGNLVG